MEQEHNPAEHREVAHPKQGRDGAIGQRHRGQPQKAHRHAKQIRRDFGDRRPQEQHNHYRPQQIQAGEQTRLGHAATEPTRRVGAKYVEQANQGQHRGAHRGRQVLVDQVRRQVHTDKHYLETAHKKAEGQQPEAGVGAGLFQRFAQGLLAHRDRQRPVLEHGDQRQDQRHHQAQRQQRCRPAEPANQAEGTGHHGELTKRARRAGNTHGHAAFFGRYGAADHAEDHRERGAGQANANQQTCAQRQ